jgi:hypothetical protein
MATRATQVKELKLQKASIAALPIQRAKEIEYKKRVQVDRPWHPRHEQRTRLLVHW